MFSPNQELYNYSSDIQQQMPRDQMMFNHQQLGNGNNQAYRKHYSEFVEHLENEDAMQAQQAMQGQQQIPQQQIPQQIQDPEQNQNIISNPSKQLKEIAKYYLITLIVPLLLFVVIFVIFSLDFVKDPIFKFLNIQTNEEGVSIFACVLYGLIIGAVYLLFIKIIDRFI